MIVTASSSLVQLNDRFDALAKLAAKGVELPPNLAIATYAAEKKLEKHAVWNMFVSWIVAAAKHFDGGHKHWKSAVSEDELYAVAKSKIGYTMGNRLMCVSS